MIAASQRWPALFTDTDDGAVHALDKAVAAVELEGWRPDAESVALLLDECTGATVVPAVVADVRRPPQPVTWRARLSRHAPYVYPGTQLLRNEFDITDAKVFHSVEHLITALRLCQFHTGQAEVSLSAGVHALLDLHRHLFQDCYSWAGSTRTVGITKGTSTFARVPMIWEILADVDGTIRETAWATLDEGELAFASSRIYADVNHAHPFREGNGRAASTLLHHLLAPTSWWLDLSTVAPAEWVAAASDSMPFRTHGRASARPFVPILRRTLRPR